MPETLSLRPAEVDDLPALGDLKLRASLAWGDHLEALQAMPDARTVPEAHLPFVTVAELVGRIVGFVTVLQRPDDRAELEDLFIDPNLWRQGIGRRLMAKAERQAVVSGANVLYVTANRRAERFYARLGFVTVGSVPTDLELASAMEKRLAA